MKNRKFLKKTIKKTFSYSITRLICVVSLFTMPGCAFKFINRKKNIEYNATDTSATTQKLNVFAPAGNKNPKPVFIFVHGGNWNSGNKNLYSYFGSRMARKGIVTVIPNYPKSPAADYEQMATDITAAVKWTKEHIGEYGGDSNRIFISGHSAGGHLAALVSIKLDYFKKLQITNPIKGLVLIDAAGLDMYGYLKEENLPAGDTYYNTFSNNAAVWKQASPIYFLHNNMPAMLIYRGGKTYPSIISSNEKFTDSLKKYNVKFTYQLQPSKKHVPMITQFFNPYNKRYAEIISFMKAD